MTMLQRKTFVILVLAPFAVLFSSASQFFNDGKEMPSTSWNPSAPSFKINESHKMTQANIDIAAMAGDHENIRRINNDLLPNENDINFIDQLFNSIRWGSHILSNRTIVLHESPNGTAISYTLCHLALFLGFQSNSVSAATSTNAIREIASALMALRDFNAGDSSIVPQIRPPHCDGKLNLMFTMELVNTAYQPLTAATELTKILKRKRQPAEVPNGNVVQAYPSGIIGAARSSVSSPLSILAGVNDLVTISHGSSANSFSSKVQYPLFGRTIPSTDDNADAATAFFHEVLNATHLGVLHVNDPYGVSYAHSIRNAASEVNIMVRKISLPVRASREEAARALNRLKATGIRYFMAILFDEELETVMPLAYEMGIAGEKHFWMFTESLMHLINSASIGGFDIPPAAHGSAILATSMGKDLLRGTRFYDAYTSHFSELWKSETGWDYVQSKLPHLNLTKDLIEGSEPSVFELFLYEAVVALCLASCDAAADAYPSFFKSNALYESFTRTTFDGLYGPLSFDHETGDRSVDTAKYAVYNILASESNSKVEAKYQLVMNEENNSTSEKYWESLPSTEFIYADGTTKPPINLPPLKKDKNLIPTEAAAVCLSICGVILILSVICAVWTYRERTSKVVCASQPFFLYMLCAGTFINTSAVIPGSMQVFHLSSESKGAGCIGALWLRSVGFVISFSALFTKTKRINMIMEMGKKLKRVVIKPIDVMKPFFIILFLNVSLLIALTVVAPFKYNRHTFDTSVDRFGRLNSSIGFCSPDEDREVIHTILTSLLDTINSVVVALSAYYAYHSRNISTEYNESHYIAFAVYIELQICLVGYLRFALRTNPTAMFAVSIFSIFSDSLGNLFPLFLPKMVALRDERKKQLEKEKKKKERLERLQKFDALKKEQEDTVMLSAKETLGSAAMGASNSGDEFDETPKKVEEEYGVKVTSFSMDEKREKMQVAISKVRRENQRLKSSINSTKKSMSSGILSKKISQ